MNNYHVFLALILIASPIFCKEDLVNLDMDTIYQKFSQDDLKNDTTEISEIYQCSKLANKYYRIISDSLTIENRIWAYGNANYFMYITFDAIMLNIDQNSWILGQMNQLYAKNGKVNFNGSEKTFYILGTYADYGCMTHSKSTNLDGRISVAMVFPLDRDQSIITTKISPNDIGSDVKFGIANLKIVQVSCGHHASFSVSLNKCICDSGYKKSTPLDKPHGSVEICMKK